MMKIVGHKLARDHLMQNLRVVQDDHGRDLSCPDIEILANVIQNWAGCEGYFREGGNFTGYLNTSGLISNYQKTGQFVVSFQREDEGEKLYLVYGGPNERRTIPWDLLQEHVQWTVLDSHEAGSTSEAENNKDKEILVDFIHAYETAQAVHKVVLALESLGHPDYQSNVSPLAIAKTCLYADVSARHQELVQLLSDWQSRVTDMTTSFPRLNLLKMKSRTNFLLELRRTETDIQTQLKRLFPYILQMFPHPIDKRDALFEKLVDCLQEFRQLDELRNYWDAALALLTLLSQGEDVENVANPQITCVCFQDLGYEEVYLRQLIVLLTEYEGAIPVLPSSILYCGNNTTEIDINDILMAATTSFLKIIHIVYVDRLSPRLREHLARGLRSIHIKCSVVLVFASQDGFDSFTHYPSEAIDLNSLDSDRYESLWINTAKNCEVSVVSGPTGFGKSKYIEDDAHQLGMVDLTYAIHEGFSGAIVLKEYAKAVENLQDKVGIALTFSLSIYGDIESFHQFLHSMLVSGILVDDISGEVVKLASLPHRIYVELPALDELSSRDLLREKACVWPPRDNEWQASEHPLLKLLPVIIAATKPLNYVKMDYYLVENEHGAQVEKHGFQLDDQSRLVGYYLALYHSPAANAFETSPLPDFLAKLSVAEDEIYLAAVNKLFHDSGMIRSSKRKLSSLIKILFGRCVYLSKLKAKADTRIDDELFRQILGYPIKNLLYIFITEALSAVADLPPSATLRAVMPPISITKENQEAESANEKALKLESLGAGFHFVSITELESNPNIQLLQSYYPNIQHVGISHGALPNHINSHIASIFGINNSSNIAGLLKDNGFIMTSESFLQILHLHTKREIAMSVISTVHTGCGKSETLKLYCSLINSDSSPTSRFIYWRLF
jgi:hypothetical protein